MAAWKLAPALAAGCTIVLKPAEQTPLSALRLGQLLLEAGLPEGVVNIVTGDGATGALLVEHPGVDKIAFTGSTAVGREIGSKAGAQIKRVTLELGGKSPNIILPDADLDAAVKGSFQAIYYNTGQSCNAGSRLFVHKDQFDEVVGALAQSARREAKVGPGLDADTQLGPLVSQEQLERVTGYIESGLEEGAELVAGGTDHPEGTPEGGYFVAAERVRRRQRRDDGSRARRSSARCWWRCRTTRSRRSRGARTTPSTASPPASGRATSPRRTSSHRCCGPARSTSTAGAPRTPRRRSAATSSRASAARWGTRTSTRYLETKTVFVSTRRRASRAGLASGRGVSGSV